ncbi:MAG: thioredoxin [Prevotella sp.]|nr:thioredoxin [Prevotellaceae bacterium]MDY3365099.1 thioredoxin [Prevotella sp.]MDY3852130.1 thioredoxin [Prevotella sp.]
MAVKITAENFESYKNGELPLVVDFWATWCGPCKMVGPIIEELAGDYEGKVVIGKCDVEESDELAAQFGVRSIPTILFFKGGELVDKFVGATNKETLEAKVQSLL